MINAFYPKSHRTTEFDEVLDFMDSMPEASFFLGGSRATAPETINEDETDYDYYVYVSALNFLKLSRVLTSLKFEDGSLAGHNYPGEVVSFRKGLANVVLVSDQKVFEAYRLATEVCQYLKH